MYQAHYRYGHLTESLESYMYSYRHLSLDLYISSKSTLCMISTPLFEGNG